ncbi:response regulator [Sciscionella marina]|uniref:response regulator n=1 Tax=Sciscionella marina TaxID=508770 RepID=UPI00036842E7|nr:response regulator transcription factor [Sciscionella marina]
MISILLADDEAMIRAGIAAILAHDPRLEVIAESEDGHQAVEAAQNRRPDVALLDIRMPGLDGLAATAEITRTVPETAVVILTTFGEEANILAALGAGAHGFLLKSGDPHELLTGVHAVAEGASYLSPPIAHRLITHLGPHRLARTAAARSALDSLTARERAVLGLLAAGHSNAQIADRLHLAEGTVKAHVSTILTRLDADNRVQAALIAYDAGLVDSSHPGTGDDH